ncbi:MAG: helix-turn-helix transcriptional regulator [Balneolaceae bacterium]|nr:helix-turn-helix transcriptional regulator [Balneolaceae bacterium]MBO6545228.1 helix-turn-helix transcriptional regulator [Balneolaceae bacterium]MBO6646624.1 helix-turn-helix transcriptional regulator [Balneolaceae bacterium]
MHDSSKIILKWILPLLVLSMVAISGAGYYVDQNIEGTGVYFCPPCGCSGDHIEHENEGFCEYCNMPLIEEKETALLELENYLAEQFRGSSTHASLYSRVVYPTLFGGVFLGVISIFFFRKKSIEFFLALYIIVWSLFGLKFQMFGTSYSLHFDIKTAFIPISFLLLLGPLLYFHSRNLLEDNFSFSKTDWLHFIPGLATFLYYMIMYFSSPEARTGHLHTDFDPYWVILEQFGGVASLVVYMSVSIQQINKLNGSQERKKNETQWLTRFYFGTYAILLVWVTNLTINAVFFEMKSSTITYFSLWVTLCIYMYWIGVEVFRNEKVLILKNFNSKRVDSSELQQFKEKIREIMEDEKPYTDPNLTLRKLAEHLGMKPKQLSGLINASFQKNFYSYVNEYRLEEVKQLLIDKDMGHLTIVAIAEKAGFNSKSTFNSYFKKETGMTPKEFKLQSDSKG